MRNLPGSRLRRFVANDLLVARGVKTLPDVVFVRIGLLLRPFVDEVADEPDRSIAHADVNAAGMEAAHSALLVAHRKARHTFGLCRCLANILFDLTASLDIVAGRHASIGTVIVVRAVPPKTAGGGPAERPDAATIIRAEAGAQLTHEDGVGRAVDDLADGKRRVDSHHAACPLVEPKLGLLARGRTIGMVHKTQGPVGTIVPSGPVAAFVGAVPGVGSGLVVNVGWTKHERDQATARRQVRRVVDRLG